eukprot:CAMPEP_0184305690 /NCGR_PEP_ID=MMETSP1049-20130417/14902_1 /TAXON_ID=77928 /ORGANISM="Proteomonas sulcata, Strain CCMP704" /LENGTH=42 /DNA_ID= /DNA_START= /DNA_END= /DNA_ORIENTATION=
MGHGDPDHLSDRDSRTIGQADREGLIKETSWNTQAGSECHPP